MRVLWFSVSPSLYQLDVNNKGLGWIASLEKIIRTNNDIQLGVAFEHNNNIFKDKRENVVYYPMNVFKNKYNILRRKYHIDIEEKLFIPRCLEIINDFQPDIIQVFGSEWCFGLIQEYTNIPVVIHLQGSIPPYQNAMFPPGYSWKEEHDLIPIWNIPWKIKHYLWKRKEEERSKREERILHSCTYFMGRTEWDYALTKLYAPESLYYKCWEALRPSFINSKDIWDKKEYKKMKLLSIGPSPLKGMDVVLKTAHLLKKWSKLDFEWFIFGANSEQLHRHEKKWGINAKECNITCLGPLDEVDVKKEILNCDIFVHLAYIDNSPNAVCEAMWLGVPIISTYTGGIPSLIESGVSGILVPPNDPWRVAVEILDLYSNPTKTKSLGKNARQIAIERHSDENINNSIIKIYKTIISQAKENDKIPN